MSQERLPDALFEEPPSDGARRLRAASVTLRDHAPESDDPASLMDPAAKSLTDALRITFRLLQWSMVILFALFLVSGSQRVESGETGIRVVFGRPVHTDLKAGLCWSLPYPLGELVKIPHTSQAISMEEAFWPYLTPHDRGRSSAELANAGGPDTLSPERDGSLLTAEGYMAHVRAVITYRRIDASKAHQSIHEEDESRIVQAAVRRGIIHAAAVLGIDEIIKGTPDPDRAPGEFRDMESIAREIAERTLSEMESGLEIESLRLTDRMPPQHVARDYNRPQQAQSQATTAIEGAQEFRRETLTAVAGQAADLILSQIDLYEEQLKLGELEEAEQTHARIDALLLGERVEIPGVSMIPQINGSVPAMLAEARQYRSTVVSSMQSDVERFRAIRESYRTNPEVVLHREWTEALKTFLARSSVQVQLLPVGERWVVQINRDPTALREEERRRLQEMVEEQRKQREQQRDRDRFNRRADPGRERLSAD